MNRDEIKALILSNDSEKLRELIVETKVLDVNMKDNSSNESLLKIACKAGFMECFTVLVDYDGSYSTNDDGHNYSLYKSCMNCMNY